MSPALPSSAAATIVGQGAFRYQALPSWAQLPPGWSFIEAVGLATDSAGNAFVFNRGEHPVIVLDRQGQFLRSWGEGFFVRPHGIQVGPDDSIYCVDDFDHSVHKFTPDGQLVFTLGTRGQSSETGARTVDYRTIRQAAGPFNFPTNLALAPGGEMVITDGYGNARIHVFSPDGRLLRSWGEPGAGPGQFHVPHGIAIDRAGTIYVADRENSRLQLFSLDGRLLDEWASLARPSEVAIDDDQNVYIAELGYCAGMFPGDVPPPGATTGGRLSIFNSRGELRARFGGGDNPCAAGDFFAPHDVWIDRFGDFYVSEVTMSAGGNRGLVSPDCHTLQKFVRVSPQGTP
jgi:DNA-binding beta-propeller fold protein YncE